MKWDADARESSVSPPSGRLRPRSDGREDVTRCVNTNPQNETPRCVNATSVLFRDGF